MSSAQKYTVEISQEKALLICDFPVFREYLTRLLTGAGVEVTVLDSGQFQAYAGSFAEGELDYLISFSPSVTGLPPSLRTFIILPLSEKRPLSSFPAGVHLCYYHDFIGASANFAPLLSRFLSESAEKKRLTIPGDGLGEYRLLTEEDVLNGLSKFIFSSSPPRELVLVNPDSVSLLSLAYRLRSLLPYKIDIVFSEEEFWSEPEFAWDKLSRGQTQIGWQPAGQFEKLLPQVIENFFAKPGSPAPTTHPRRHLAPSAPAAGPRPSAPAARPRLTPLHTPSSPAPIFVPVRDSTKIKLRLPKLSRLRTVVSRPQLPPPARIAVSSLVLAFSLYLFSLLAAGTVTALTLRSLGRGGGEGTLLSARAARTATPPAAYLQANLTVLLSLPGFRDHQGLKEANNLFTSYLLGLKTLSSVGSLAGTAQDVSSYILSDQELDLASSINVARLETDRLYEDLSLLDGSLPLEPPGIIPAAYAGSYRNIKSRLQEAKRAALTGKSLLTSAPEILGIGTRRKYAVLFQNNMELRATGGFIGSFGILSLENGKLFDIQVYDVYAADGQLKGHVEPPEEIKKYLGEANWYLRDSNWDPDFPTSARRAEWFLGKTISADVQGTVAINVNTLQDLLRATGPITIPDYDEQISADNIFERAEYHAEVNFFPGSSQKKEFIASVANTLLTELETLDSGQALALTRAMTKSIDEKNTLLALSNEKTNQTLSTLGWNGEIRDIPCPDLGGTCTSDYAMLVDSNFGVNKANYFLRRELLLDVTITKDLAVNHVLKTTYTNTSTSSSWPAGPYKNYSRLYLPAGSSLVSVTIGDKVLSREDLKITSEHDRTVVGFLVEVPINTTVTVEVGYTLSGSLASSSPVYSLYWQKQSGTAADPLTININYPLYLEPELISPQADLNNQQLQFNLSNVTDRRITVKFK